MRSSSSQFDPPQELVFKIVTQQMWQDAVVQGHLLGSSDDLRDGFIHLSTADQVAGTLKKHFYGASDLLVVAFDAANLGPALRFEPSRGGNLFPHFYGPLPTAQALWAKPIRLKSDGTLDGNLDYDSEPSPC